MPHEFITLIGNAKDITNQRFGRLVALGPIGRRDKHIEWLCHCDCGKTISASGKELRSGHTKSCGCQKRDSTIKRNTTHGMSNQPIYETWQSMIKRCTNPNTRSYPDYGGRGITVCDEWRHDFQAFYSHVSQLPHYGEKRYTLDRTNNSLGYFPGNMRFATATQQGRNQRQTIILTHNDKTQCLADWAEELGLTYSTLYQRIYLGWTTERALTTPPRVSRPRQ